MIHYEISENHGLWVIWQWINDCSCTRFKSFKTRKSAENWAAKQRYLIIWR